ncbi:MAG: aminotransferase class I/II-fold pyridoxal phosphate-dependent enzyme [Bdellovibrionota bacterium]|nr:MAG: aminotransferase class I/II-fold pyridoxal phosphate-dependent enzyme [Bdellovibrionota bacterium]
MKEETRTIHPDTKSPPHDNPPLVYPIYQSVKFSLPSVGEIEKVYRGSREGFTYSRVANPTVSELASELAALQGTECGLCFGSGIAAIQFMFQALLSQGDHVVGLLQSYRPTRSVLRHAFSKFGVKSTFLCAGDYGALEKLLRDSPAKLIFFESPTNPVLDVVDIERIAALGKAHGATVVLDNTMAGFHQHRKVPVDLYLHSLTKYATGMGDVSGGAILGSQALIDRLVPYYVNFGAALEPLVASLMLRGLKSYFLRYRAQASAALELAQWLEGRPGVAGVRYPGLPSHPQHALAKRQMQEFGTMVCAHLAYEEREMKSFLDRLHIFKVTGSFGSVDSLAAPAKMFYGGDLTPAEFAQSGITPGTVRFSVGLEALDDLKADIEQAMVV